MWVIENRFAIDQDIAPRQGGMAEVYKKWLIKKFRPARCNQAVS